MGFFSKLKADRQRRREEAERLRQQREEERRRQQAEEARAVAERKARLNAFLEKVDQGFLPKVSVNTPFRTLRTEKLVCCWQNVVYLKQQTKTEYVGGSQGMSFRVMKGVSYRVGGSRGQKQETVSFVPTDMGTFGITTKHLYFATNRPSEGKSFRVRLDKIVSVHAAEHGIFFMRDTASAKPEAFTTDGLIEGPFISALIETLSDRYGEDYDDEAPEAVEMTHDDLGLISVSEMQVEYHE